MSRQKIWVNRIELESYMHAETAFCTLTYSDEFLPAGGNLSPRDVTLFLKRLRKALSPMLIRYFIGGEYGSRTWRPHYHALLFGLHRELHHEVDKAWNLGHVNWRPPGMLLPGGAAYAAKYLCKSQSEVDEFLSRGLRPPFARMSRMPGLGSGAVPALAEALRDEHGEALIASLGDVPSQIRVGGRLVPIGRTLRDKLRVALFKTSWKERHQGVRPESLQRLHSLQSSSQSHEEVVQKIKDMNEQRVRQQEARHRIYSQKPRGIL